MQENRLSSVLVVAPATEQDLISSTEDDVSTASTSVPIDTESNQTTASDAWYNQTETTVPATITNTEISTISNTEREDFSYKPYFIPALQVTAYSSVTTDVTIPTESFGSTTENSESTSPKSSTISEGFRVGPSSVEDDILLSTEAADGPTVTSTTESWVQETMEGDTGLGNHDDVSGVREANKQGDASEQGGSNTDEKLLEGENEDGTLAEGHISEGVSIQGNDSDSNSEDESKNADDILQADNNTSQMQSASAGGGDNPYLLHTESPDYSGSEAVALDYTSDVVTTEATDGTDTTASTFC
jgi:hypothetical protein